MVCARNISLLIDIITKRKQPQTKHLGTSRGKLSQNMLNIHYEIMIVMISFFSNYNKIDVSYERVIDTLCLLQAC